MPKTAEFGHKVFEGAVQTKSEDAVAKTCGHPEGIHASFKDSDRFVNGGEIILFPVINPDLTTDVCLSTRVAVLIRCHYHNSIAGSMKTPDFTELIAPTTIIEEVKSLLEGKPEALGQ